MKRLFLLWIALILFQLGLNAASVNLIQRGSLTLTGSSTTVTLCDSVDLSSSILIFTTSNNTTNVGGSLVGGQLTNENTITFIRDQTDGSPIIEWKVI